MSFCPRLSKCPAQKQICSEREREVTRRLDKEKNAESGTRSKPPRRNRQPSQAIMGNGSGGNGKATVGVVGKVLAHAPSPPPPSRATGAYAARHVQRVGAARGGERDVCGVCVWGTWGAGHASARKEPSATSQTPGSACACVRGRQKTEPTTT